MISFALPAMELKEDTNLIDYLKDWLRKLQEWMKPAHSDNIVLKVLKFILKCIVLLVLLAFSPVIIVILVFVFFAAF